MGTLFTILINIILCIATFIIALVMFGFIVKQFVKYMEKRYKKTLDK